MGRQKTKTSPCMRLWRQGELNIRKAKTRQASTRSANSKHAMAHSASCWLFVRNYRKPAKTPTMWPLSASILAGYLAVSYEILTPKAFSKQIMLAMLRVLVITKAAQQQGGVDASNHASHALRTSLPMLPNVLTVASRLDLLFFAFCCFLPLFAWLDGWSSIGAQVGMAASIQLGGPRAGERQCSPGSRHQAHAIRSPSTAASQARPVLVHSEPRRSPRGPSTSGRRSGSLGAQARGDAFSGIGR
jgi:hypothetical protein